MGVLLRRMAWWECALVGVLPPMKPLVQEPGVCWPQRLKLMAQGG